MATKHTTGPSVSKAEPDIQLTNGESLRIKSELDSGAISPLAQSDEDIYEDAGDLDFASTTQGFYLTRIPRFLWETWSKLEDDVEIHLGTVRVEGGLDDLKRVRHGYVNLIIEVLFKDVSLTSFKMSLLLSSDAIQNRTVPKEYNMHITNQDSSNTFIFTEKDLPGYASRMKGGTRKGQSNGGGSSARAPPRAVFRDRSRQGLSQVDKNKRWQPSFRKAIPSK